MITKVEKMLCVGTLSLFLTALLVYFVSIIFVFLELALQTVSFHTSLLTDKQNKGLVMIQSISHV